MVADMPVLLLFGDTERSPAMRHEVPVSIGDPLMFAEVDGRVTILTTWLERDRIAAVLPDVEPAEEDAGLIGDQERLVRTALEQARGAVRPGVTGRELYEATCDLFEAAGWATQRTGGEDGFQFALGHGVGLEVHEPPGLGLSGEEPFVAGDVIAIEPRTLGSPHRGREIGGSAAGDSGRLRDPDRVSLRAGAARRLTSHILSFTVPLTPNSTTRFSARIRHNGNRICRQSGGNQHDAPARSHRARL
jgi:hypothetical protein